MPGTAPHRASRRADRRPTRAAIPARRAAHRCAARARTGVRGAVGAASETVSSWIASIEATSCSSLASSSATIRSAPARFVELLRDQVRVSAGRWMSLLAVATNPIRIDFDGRSSGAIQPIHSWRPSQPGTGRVPSPWARTGWRPCTGSRCARRRRRRRSSVRRTRPAASRCGTRRSRPPGRPRARATAAASRRGPTTATRGAIERTVARVQGPGDAVGQDRTVPRLAHEQARGSGSPRTAIRSSCVVRVPTPGGAHRGAVVVELLFVQVGDIARDVGGAPGVVRRRAEEDPRGERRRDPARLVAGRAQHELEPDPRLRHQVDAGRWRGAGRRSRCGGRRRPSCSSPAPPPAAATGRRCPSRRVRVGRRAPLAAVPPPSCSTGSTPGGRTPMRTPPRPPARPAADRAVGTRSGPRASRRSRRGRRHGTARASRGRARSRSRQRGARRRG